MQATPLGLGLLPVAQQPQGAVRGSGLQRVTAAWSAHSCNLRPEWLLAEALGAAEVGGIQEMVLGCW